MKSTTLAVRPLTGIRGIAALIVVCFHYFPDLTLHGHAIFGKGYLAVDLFFMLSGIVLALNYAATVNSNASLKTYTAFIVKRLIRVYPLYIAGTLLIVAIAVLRHIVKGVPYDSDMSVHLLASNLLLVQSWGIGRSLLAPAWSISVEFAAYVAFPLLVMITLEARRNVAIAFGVASVIWLFIGSLSPEAEGSLGFWEGDSLYPVLRCIAGFSFGLLGYRAMADAKVRSFMARNEVFYGALVLTVLCGYFSLNDFVTWALLLLCVLTSYANGTAANLVFGNTLVYFLGTISYSMYLAHALIWSYLSQLNHFATAHFGISRTFTFLCDSAQHPVDR